MNWNFLKSIITGFFIGVILLSILSFYTYKSSLNFYNSRFTIPVVMLTSSAEDPDIERCYNLGANSYIVKPVDFEHFEQTVIKLGVYWNWLNKPKT